CSSPAIPPLSLHDALPIYSYDVTLSAEGKELTRTRLDRATAQFARMAAGPWTNGSARVPGFANPAQTLAEEKAEAAKPPARPARSEEHTSELQSHLNLVCR